MQPTADEGEPLRSEAVDWLLRLQASPDDPALQADHAAWLAASDGHRRAWQSIQRVWGLSGDLEQAEATVVALPRRRRVRRVLGIGLAALAACVAFYLAPILKLRLEADHMTSVAELREVRLEDGSVVTLDAGSAIAVRYGAARREVALLVGRAFFQVVPAQDRPFVVLADEVRISVVGTAFDVRSAGDGVTVDVQSGTVEVAVTDGTQGAPKTLTRGERVSVGRRDRKVVRSAVVPDDVASWREHRLIVDGAPLGEVIEELERHHAGAIVLRDRALAARRVTGVFDLRRPLEALEAVARSQHASVTEITPYLLLLSPGEGR